MTREEVLEKLKNDNNDFCNADLSDSDLSNINLSGIKLCGANLANTNLCGADLNDADLTGANLANADLTGASLVNAKLSGADLRRTNLSDTKLNYANLNSANLYEAKLCNSDLTQSYLTKAKLCNAYLINANLEGTDLSNAELTNAGFDNANLVETILDAKEEIRRGLILTKKMIGYKKLYNDVIIKLEIPKGAIVFSINNGKCRTNIATPVEIISNPKNYKKLISMHDNDFTYEIGKKIIIKDFLLAYNIECATGIHFFRTLEEAKNYHCF